MPQAEASPPLSLPLHVSREPGFRWLSPSTASAWTSRGWARCVTRCRASLSRTLLCLGAYSVCAWPAVREGATCSCASRSGSHLVQGPTCLFHT